MAKPKLPRMQHLSWETLRVPRRIDFVAKQRVTEMMKVHANLMSSSAMWPAFDETGPIAGPNDAILGFGRATAQNCRAHSLSMNWMAPNISFDDTGRFVQFSGDQCKINLLHRSFSELFG